MLSGLCERARWLLAAGGTSCLVRRPGKPRAESETPAPCVEGDFGTHDLDVTAREAGNQGAASRVSFLTSPWVTGDHVSQAGTHQAGPLGQVASLTSALPYFLPFFHQSMEASTAASNPALPQKLCGFLPPPSSTTSAFL